MNERKSKIRCEKGVLKWPFSLIVVVVVVESTSYVGWQVVQVACYAFACVVWNSRKAPVCSAVDEVKRLTRDTIELSERAPA